MPRDIRPIRSGELRHIGDLERLITPNQDDSGGPIVAFETVAMNVRFKIDDFRVYESLQAAQVQSLLTTKISIRYRPGMEGTAPGIFRLKHVILEGTSPIRTDYYDIQGAIRDPLLRLELQLSCIRRDAEGFRTGLTNGV